MALVGALAALDRTCQSAAFGHAKREVGWVSCKQLVIFQLRCLPLSSQTVISRSRAVICMIHCVSFDCLEKRRYVVYVAGGALFSRDRQAVLMATRKRGSKEGGTLEFPGGKLEKNESPEDGLARELKEELHVTSDPACMTPITFASKMLSHRKKSQLILLLFAVPSWECTEPSSEAEGVAPQEGQSIEWFTSYDLQTASTDRMATADINFLPYVKHSLEHFLDEYAG